jgi:hypothetical protein
MDLPILTFIVDNAFRVENALGFFFCLRYFWVSLMNNMFLNSNIIHCANLLLLDLGPIQPWSASENHCAVHIQKIQNRKSENSSNSYEKQ